MVTIETAFLSYLPQKVPTMYSFSVMALHPVVYGVSYVFLLSANSVHA